MTAICTRALVITGYALSIRPDTLSPYDFPLKPVRGDELLAGIKRITMFEIKTISCWSDSRESMA